MKSQMPHHPSAVFKPNITFDFNIVGTAIEVPFGFVLDGESFDNIGGCASFNGYAFGAAFRSHPSAYGLGCRITCPPDISLFVKIKHEFNQAGYHLSAAITNISNLVSNFYTIPIYKWGENHSPHAQSRPMRCDKFLPGQIEGSGRGDRGLPVVIERPNKESGASDAQPHLPLAKGDSVFSRFRHAPLFAQIGLFVALGLGAMGIGPIGLIHLFPAGSPRRWITGLLYAAVGVGSYAMILCLLFFGI